MICKDSYHSNLLQFGKLQNFSLCQELYSEYINKFGTDIFIQNVMIQALGYCGKYDEAI